MFQKKGDAALNIMSLGDKQFQVDKTDGYVLLTDLDTGIKYLIVHSVNGVAVTPILN